MEENGPVQRKLCFSVGPYYFPWPFLFFSEWPDDIWCWLFCLGFILPAVLLIATGYVDCNAALAVFLITTAVGFSGISFAGWAVNHLDLAPQYAGQSRRIVSLAAENKNTIRYDTRCYFNVRSKADTTQLNLPHGTDN